MDNAIPSPVTRRPVRGSWIMALLVILPALIFPPLRLIPGQNYMDNWLSIVDFVTQPGGVGWRLVTYLKAVGTVPADAQTALVVFLLPCVVALLVLTLSTLFGWRWLVERPHAPRLTLGRALGVVVTITVVSALITSVLNTALLVAAMTLPGATEGQGLGMLFMVLITALGHLAFLPLLLFGGIMLARRQSRAEA